MGAYYTRVNTVTDTTLQSFFFFITYASRKQKLKNIKMPFPKRSFTLLGGGKAQRGNIESVTLHQLDFVVIVMQS